MKILLNLPDYRHIHGGVTNHFVGLRPYWRGDVRYNRIGKRREGWPGMLWLPYDYAKFVMLNIFTRPDVVMLNPSFNRKSWLRDMMFLRLARLTGRRVAVMFHGWTHDYVSSLDPLKVARLLNKASVIYVLASEFREQLRWIGVKTPIELTTTKVADGMLEGFDINTRRGRMRNFLFMARVLREKGIMETMRLFKHIEQAYPDATLTVAGDGADLNMAKDACSLLSLRNVRFTGHIQGDELSALMRRSDAYILPSYSEGMPTSVLEAMAFGLPVLTRPVGGLKDFFEDGRMGIMTESLDPAEYWRLLRPLMDDPERVAAISRYNHSYAVEHFMASKVAQSLEESMTKHCGK